MEKTKPSNETWTMPAGLERCTPRQVTLSGAGWALSAVATLIAASAIALPVFMALDKQQKDHERESIKRRGIATEAIITRVGRTSGDHPARFAGYRYSIGDQVYTGRVELGDSDGRPLAIGELLPVRYLAERPAASWVVGYEPEGPPIAVIAILPVMFAFVAAMIAWAINGQRSLLAEGRAAPATVVAVKRRIAAVKPAGYGHSSAYRVEYEVKLLSGSIARIRIHSNEKPKEGTMVTLIYDRDHPQTAIRYPLPLVRLART